MSDTENYQEVYFNKYCETCKHKDTKEHWDPCNECLENGMNVGSHKPTHYEEK